MKYKKPTHNIMIKDIEPSKSFKAQTTKAIFSIFFLLVTTPKNLMKFAVRRDLESVKTFIAALTWHFSNDVASRRLGYKFDMLVK